jgi:soluble P-type ATPase
LNDNNYQIWKKVKIQQLRNLTNSKIIAIGNGDLDGVMLKEADVGIAFNASKNVNKASNVVIRNKDMNEILNVIKKIEKQ